MSQERLRARAGGTTSSSALSGFSFIESFSFHLPTGLDTEIGEVARALAVGAYHFAARMILRSEGSRGGLKPLLFAMSYKIFLLMDGTKDHIRVERSTGACSLNCGL